MRFSRNRPPIKSSAEVKVDDHIVLLKHMFAYNKHKLITFKFWKEERAQRLWSSVSFESDDYHPLPNMTSTAGPC